MRISSASLALAVSVAMAAPVAAQDELPEWPQRVIDFELKEEPLKVEGFANQPGQPWPRYAASFVIELGPGRVTERRQIGGRVDDWLLQSPSAEQLSEAQRALVRSADAVIDMSEDRRSTRRLTRDELGIQLYAVTEEDARVMTYAVIEWLERGRRENFERARRYALDSVARLAERRQELEKFLRKHPDPAGKLKEARESSWYGNAEEAQDDVRTLERALRSVDVDIAGITAKRSSIRKYLRDSGAVQRPGVEDMLHQLLIQQDIEMAGAAARKAAVESHLQQAHDYVEAVETDETCRKMRSRLDIAEASVEQRKETLRDPGEPSRPIQLQGPVTIQPVEYSRE
jgi:hypothetical protein